MLSLCLLPLRVKSLILLHLVKGREACMDEKKKFAAARWLEYSNITELQKALREI